MLKLNQRGVVHLLLPILLLLGIIAGVFLITQGPKIFKSKASGSANIVFIDETGAQITQTTSTTAKVQISDTTWSAQLTANRAVAPSNLFNSTPKKNATCQVPAQPTNLKPTGKINPGNNNLTWDPVSNATKGYYLAVDDKISSFVGCPSRAIQNPGDLCTSTKTNSYTFNFQTSRSYSWGVTAVNDCGRSKPAMVALTVGPNPTPTPTVTPVPTPTPVPVTTVSVTLAEDPNFTVNTISTVVGTTSYTFSNSTPGTKTLYAKFIGSDGSEQNANPFPATIELIAPSPSPTAAPSPSTVPSPSPGTVTLWLSPLSATVGANQTVLVTINLATGTQPVDGAATYLNFDPTMLQVTDASGNPVKSITAGSTLGLVLQNTVDNNAGQINFAAGSLAPLPNGTFTLASFYVKVLNTITSSYTNYIYFVFDPSHNRDTAVTKSGNSLPLTIYGNYGNGGSTPAPSGILMPAKRVFVTSTTYNGNLGGLSGADNQCQARANSANLGGSWKAWLSDSSTSASSRLSHNNGPYVLVNGIQVASTWTDLTDGVLLNPIKITENGTSTTSISGLTWTNSNPDGTIASTVNSCSNWTSSVSGFSGNFGGDGSSHNIDSQWTNSGAAGCNLLNSLYCFEQ